MCGYNLVRNYIHVVDYNSILDREEVFLTHSAFGAGIQNLFTDKSFDIYLYFP